MKIKKLNKKLSLNKATVADLEVKDMNSVKGGYQSVEHSACPTCETICFPKCIPTLTCVVC